LEGRLQGLGYGFLVPRFFIKAGAGPDRAALLARPATLLLVPLIAVAMLAKRGLPVPLLYRRAPPPPQRRALALQCSTQLPLVVAFAAIGVQNGAMPGWQGAAPCPGEPVTRSLPPRDGAGVLNPP
jgi:Kef-type K+ transport system membrane component KefB